MNTNNKKEWERIVSRAHKDINGHCPLAEDEAIIEADKQIKQLEQEYELCKLANKSLKDALDDERKIIEAQKYVMEAFQKELNALKAHCEQLRDVLLGYNAGFPSHQADKALNATPAQSLAEIQAQAVEPVLLDKYEYFDEHGKYTVVDVEDIKCRIQRLREDA